MKNDAYIRFRMTTKLKEQIETNAKENDMKVSEYLRKLVMEDTLKRLNS